MTDHDHDLDQETNRKTGAEWARELATLDVAHLLELRELIDKQLAEHRARAEATIKALSGVGKPQRKPRKDKGTMRQKGEAAG